MALTARAAFLAGLGVLAVLLAPEHGAMVGYVAAAIVMLCLIDVMLAASPRATAIARKGASSTRVGEPAVVTLTLANQSRRRARGWVRDAWPPSAAASPRAQPVAIEPGARTTVTTTLVPTRRGARRAASVTLRYTGPLGLAARQRTREQPWTLQVLPTFASRRFLPEKLARLRQLDGAVVAPVRGQGSEFDSLRGYVVGDDPRSIDWRATARRSDVVVRTWRPERDRQLVLVLDGGRTSAARVGGAPRFDAALDATLLMTALARHAGDRVQVIAHDRQLRVDVDARKSTSSLNTVVRALTSIEPRLVETDMPAVIAHVLRRAPKRSLVVLFTAIDPAVTEGLLPSLSPLLRRHIVLVAAVSDPAVARLRHDREDAAAVYAAAAAERGDAQRRAVASGLRRRGVVVTEAPPDVFASHVADAYLELKAAGRL